MGPRNGAIALAIVASLASATIPSRALAVEPTGAQGATEVTVDLSALGSEGPTTTGALAHTADPYRVEALVLGAVGLLAGGMGCLLYRAGRLGSTSGTEGEET